jgi:protein-arginine kinase activator protein McsA
MIQSCPKCQSTFDNLRQRSDCPHLDFPKQCKEHNRFNCGNCKEHDKPNLIPIRKEA